MDAMKAEQISVFVENRAGRLAEVIHVLGQAGINIRALSLTDTSDFGILRMIVCEQERAKIILKENGFTLGTTNVLAVEVPDRPGGLDSALQTLSANGINVEYMYAFMKREEANAVMILRIDKVDDAINVLTSHHFNIIPGASLCE